MSTVSGAMSEVVSEAESYGDVPMNNGEEEPAPLCYVAGAREMEEKIGRKGWCPVHRTKHVAVSLTRSEAVEGYRNHHKKGEVTVWAVRPDPSYSVEEVEKEVPEDDSDSEDRDESEPVKMKKVTVYRLSTPTIPADNLYIVRGSPME